MFSIKKKDKSEWGCQDRACVTRDGKYICPSPTFHKFTQYVFKTQPEEPFGRRMLLLEPSGFLIWIICGRTTVPFGAHPTAPGSWEPRPYAMAPLPTFQLQLLRMVPRPPPPGSPEKARRHTASEQFNCSISGVEYEADLPGGQRRDRSQVLQRETRAGKHMGSSIQWVALKKTGSGSRWRRKKKTS